MAKIKLRLNKKPNKKISALWKPKFSKFFKEKICARHKKQKIQKG